MTYDLTVLYFQLLMVRSLTTERMRNAPPAATAWAGQDTAHQHFRPLGAPYDTNFRKWGALREGAYKEGEALLDGQRLAVQPAPPARSEVC